MKPLVVGLWFLGGAAIELFNAWTLDRTARQLEPGRKSRAVGWFLGGFVVRVVLTAGVLALAFRHSFVAGLLAWLGYYVCRTIVTWRLARRLGRSSGGSGGLGEKVGAKDG